MKAGNAKVQVDPLLDSPCLTRPPTQRHWIATTPRRMTSKSSGAIQMCVCARVRVREKRKRRKRNGRATCAWGRGAGCSRGGMWERGRFARQHAAVAPPGEPFKNHAARRLEQTTPQAPGRTSMARAPHHFYAPKVCSLGPPCDSQSRPGDSRARPRIRPVLSDPGGGGGRGLNPPPPRGIDPPTHPHQKAFPQEQNEIYERGPNLEVDLRYTNFFLASDPPLCDIKSISGCFTGPRTVTRLSFTA